MSLADLAVKLDLTYQQVQKYESGQNRISASKLYQAAQALDAPVASFFEDIEDGASDTVAVVDDPESASDAAVSGHVLARLFSKMKSERHRRSVLDLISVLAEDEA